MRLLALLLLAACGSSTATTPPARPVAPKAQTTPKKIGERADAPPPALRDVRLSEAEAHRLYGETVTVPDPTTLSTMRRAGLREATPALKTCIDVHGAVSSVTLERSSGHTPYDDQLRAAIGMWRFRPFLVDGVPGPVCTVVSFTLRLRP